MSKKAMKLALEALKELVAQTETGLFAVRHDHVAMNDARQAITVLREALAEQPAQQEAQAEETVKERTPQERRDAGEWHCPECFTFGHQHRQGCTAAHGIKENT